MATERKQSQGWRGLQNPSPTEARAPASPHAMPALVPEGRLRNILLIILASEVAITGIVAVIHILFFDLTDLWGRLMAFFWVTVYYTIYSFYMGQPLVKTAKEPRSVGVLFVRSLSTGSLATAATAYVLALLTIWTSGYQAHEAVEKWAWSGFVISLGFVASLMVVALERGTALTLVPVFITVAGVGISTAVTVVAIHIEDFEGMARPFVASLVFTATGMLVSIILSRIEKGRMEQTPSP